MSLEPEAERRVATAALTWAQERGIQSERALADALESWLVAVFPPLPGWEGRWSDGLLVNGVDSGDGRDFRVEATVFRIAPQTRHRAVFSFMASGDALNDYEIRFWTSANDPEIVIGGIVEDQMDFES
jgi:hypothetical protein